MDLEPQTLDSIELPPQIHRGRPAASSRVLENWQPTLATAPGLVSTRLDLPFKAAVHVVRHEQQHAKLLQGDELHVPLVALAHVEPLQ